MSLPSPQWPANEAASLATPSCMQPSPANTYVKLSNSLRPGLLYVAAMCDSASARPTPLATPCPNGPVVTSTPSVWLTSGCPGVLLSICLNRFSSSMERSYPARWSSAYWRQHPCPLDSRKRSRFHQWDDLGLYRISLAQRTWATGAMPMGMPGWPALAFCTMSAARTRMVLTASLSSSVYEDMSMRADWGG